MLLTRVELHLLSVGRCRHPEWVTLKGGRFAPIDFPAMAALILHPTAGPILYDTGYAERFQEATEPFPERLYRWLTPVHLPAEERLAAQLARFGLAPGDIQRVLISHLHADHVAGLRDLPQAGFLALRDDVLGSLGKRGYDLIGDRSLIGIPLPGHSPAQLGVLLQTTAGRPVLLAADSCWSATAWKEGRLPSVVARPLFADWQSYRRTLSGLRELAGRQPDLAIVPSHCAATISTFSPEPPRP